MAQELSRGWNWTEVCQEPQGQLLLPRVRGKWQSWKAHLGLLEGTPAPHKASSTIPLHLGRKHSPALVSLSTLQGHRLEPAA